MVATISSAVTGVVRAANARGVRLDGQDEWTNWSRWAEHVVTPQPGERVVLRLDAAGFIRALSPAAPAQAPTEPAPDAPGDAPAGAVDRDRRILRQAVLNTATAILATQARPLALPDVLGLAEQLERWVLR